MTKLTKAQLALRTKWTTALRSGVYQQAYARLRTKGGHCCLGVLCDVSGLGQWMDGNYFKVGPDTCFNFPPTAVSVAAGVDGDFTCGLTERNDIDWDDFATLADTIDLDTLMRQDGCL